MKNIVKIADSKDINKETVDLMVERLSHGLIARSMGKKGESGNMCMQSLAAYTMNKDYVHFSSEPICVAGTVGQFGMKINDRYYSDNLIHAILEFDIFDSSSVGHDGFLDLVKKVRAIKVRDYMVSQLGTVILGHGGSIYECIINLNSICSAIEVLGYCEDFFSKEAKKYLSDIYKICDINQMLKDKDIKSLDKMDVIVLINDLKKKMSNYCANAVSEMGPNFIVTRFGMYGLTVEKNVFLKNYHCNAVLSSDLFIQEAIDYLGLVKKNRNKLKKKIELIYKLRENHVSRCVESLKLLGSEGSKFL